MREIKIDEKVIDILGKTRNYVDNEKSIRKGFPLDNMIELADTTIGAAFWNCLCEKPSLAFQKLPEMYRKCFEHAMEKEDKEACLLLLDLLEYNYRTLMTAMSEEERISRERPYLKMILEEGSAYAELQYRLHMQRQKDVSGEKRELAAGRGVVYSCLLGDEKIYQPNDIETKVEYLCFTDNKDMWGKKQGAWKFVELNNPDKLPDDMIRTKYRILAHEMLPDYDYSIWVERSFAITGELQHFCEVYGNGNSFLGFSQPTEDCIYRDISYTHMGTDERNIEMRKMMYRYKQEGYPEHNGLIDSRIMIRNHNDPMMRRVMEDWWLETEKYNEIETNCFNYVAWKNQYPFSICDLFIYHNSYFTNGELNLNPQEEI